MPIITQSPEAPKLRLTFFSDLSGSNKEERELTLAEFGSAFEKLVRPSKAELPLFSPVLFGDVTSKYGSYRYNGNARSIFGVMGDSDDGHISFPDAVSSFKEANVCALIYTTASHRVEKPRLRIFTPTSAQLGLRYHSALTARANGIVGGAFAPESFTLSQAYYYGSVEGSADQHLELVEGDYIDLRNDLDAAAIGKRSSYSTNATRQGSTETYDAAWLEKLLELIPSQNLSYGEWIESGLACKRAGLSFNSWASLSRKHVQHCDNDSYLLQKWESFHD